MSEITREVLVKGLSKGKHSLAEETTSLEEKKESSDLPVDAVHASAKSGEGDLESGLSPPTQKRQSRFQELPEGLAELFGDRVFRDEDELEKHLCELENCRRIYCLMRRRESI